MTTTPRPPPVEDVPADLPVSDPAQTVQIELPSDLVETLTPADLGWFTQPVATILAASIALVAALIAFVGVSRQIKTNRDIAKAQIRSAATQTHRQLKASEQHLQRQLDAQAAEHEKNRKVSRRAEDLKVVAKAVELVHKLWDVGHIAELNLYAHEDLESPHLESEEYRATVARARERYLSVRDDVPVSASQLQVLGFDDAATALLQMSALAEMHAFNPSGKKRDSIDEARGAVIKVFTSALDAPEGHGTDLE